MEAASWASRSSNPCRLDGWARSSGGSCTRRGSTWESWMSATGSQRHKGSDWMAGLGYFVGEPFITRCTGFSLPPLPLFLLVLFANTDRANLEAQLNAGLLFKDNADRRRTINSAVRCAEAVRTTIGSPRMSMPYRPSYDELTQWMFQLLRPTQNGITTNRYESQRSCGRLLHCELSYRWDYENWTHERRYAHPGDGIMLGDGWQSIDCTMVMYTKLCGILPYLVFLLWFTVYETSNWIHRCIYMYRRPSRTEYNSDHYSKAHIKQP